MGKYFTELERYKLETMLKDGLTPVQIATRLNKHFTTIYKEIKKGSVKLLNSDLTYRYEYCADYAQNITIERSHHKGRDIKLGQDYALANLITSLVKDYRYSPYAVAQVIKADASLQTKLCETTIYSYIHNNVFLDISDSDLHYNLKKTKNVTKEKRPSYQKLRCTNIEDRPRHISKRNTFGHWEMDTVYSGKDKGKTCLLVLTERMTRQELIRKMPDRTYASTVQSLDSIEKEIGFQAFTEKFLSITVDNGSEFGNGKRLEISPNGKPRTKLYYCHPYCSSERGSNENANGLIRYFIPKGEDIGRYSVQDIQYIEDWINNYPRKLFGGLSCIQYKARLGIP